MTGLHHVGKVAFPFDPLTAKVFGTMTRSHFRATACHDLSSNELGRENIAASNGHLRSRPHTMRAVHDAGVTPAGISRFTEFGPYSNFEAQGP